MLVGVKAFVGTMESLRRTIMPPIADGQVALAFMVSFESSWRGPVCSSVAYPTGWVARGY